MDAARGPGPVTGAVSSAGPEPSGPGGVMSERTPWYRCRVGRGLLPGEYTVIGETAEGGMFSLIAHQSLIDLRGAAAPATWDQWTTGFLRLRWAEAQESFYVARLPVPAVQQGSYVKVATDRVEWME